METEAADIDAFLAETWKFDETKTVNEALAGQIAIIGENMNIRRFLYTYGWKDWCFSRRCNRRC